MSCSTASRVKPSHLESTKVPTAIRKRVRGLPIGRVNLVALPAERLDEIREVLSGVLFVWQKCIYLSVAGHVEFIEPPATGAE